MDERHEAISVRENLLLPNVPADITLKVCYLQLFDLFNIHIIGHGQTGIIMFLTYFFNLAFETTFNQCVQGSLTCHWGSHYMGQLLK